MWKVKITTVFSPSIPVLKKQKLFLGRSGGILCQATDQTSMLKQSIKQNKKIALVIAFRDFKDEEYFIPKEIFEEREVKVITASTERGVALGADGGEIKTDFLISELKPADFDAVVFVGGPGALKYLDNEISYKIIKETESCGKILGAICISPVILAKAGVLLGKKATVWSSPLDREPIKILKENGAEYVNEDVVIDGKIITANGPSSASKFGENIIELLT